MDLLANLAQGCQTAISPINLTYCFLGVFLGTLIGVLPGIGALAAVSMLLPVTFYIPPTTALVMLAGVYYGAEYGGSIASILLNLPGTPSAAVTCLDGYPMSKEGRAGVALFMTTIASFVGATAGILTLTAFAPVLANLALSFGPTEYFSVMVLGLIAAAAITQGSAVKGLAMVGLALFFGVLGYDMRLLHFEPAPLLIGSVLGPMIEENFRRAMLFSRGDYATFITQPVSATLLGLAVLLFLWSVIGPVRKSLKTRRENAPAK